VIDSEQFMIPENQYDSHLTMSSGEFARICREMSQITETILIETNKSHVKFSVEGDIGEGSILLKPINRENNPSNLKLIVNNPLSQRFALRFLNLFNKAMGLGPTVKLSLLEGSPIIVEFDIENLGDLKFYLAPKIGDDEITGSP